MADVNLDDKHYSVSRIKIPETPAGRSRRLVNLGACSGSRCGRKHSVRKIPLRKVLFEPGVPIGSKTLVEEV